MFNVNRERIEFSMDHKMSLFTEPFYSIQNGKKMYEVRLNDEKRRKIKVGDCIEFVKIPNYDETLHVKVQELRTYATFKEMYKDIPFHLFDCEGWTLEEMIDGTFEIYTKEQERKWGTLAIKIALIE